MSDINELFIKLYGVIIILMELFISLLLNSYPNSFNLIDNNFNFLFKSLLIFSMKIYWK